MTENIDDEGEMSRRNSLNRTTYDRIAKQYAEHQRRDVLIGESLFSELEQHFLSQLPTSGLVADVGCGPGFDAIRFSARGLRVIGVDVSTGMLDVASQGLAGRLVQADMRTLPITSGLVDGIWCVASLLHVPETDTSQVLSEFKRVLRRSGHLALVTAIGVTDQIETVPYAPEEKRWFVYRKAEVLKQQLVATGFSITLEDEVQGNRLWSTVLVVAE